MRRRGNDYPIFISHRLNAGALSFFLLPSQFPPVDLLIIFATINLTPGHLPMELDSLTTFLQFFLTTQDRTPGTNSISLFTPSLNRNTHTPSHPRARNTATQQQKKGKKYPLRLSATQGEVFLLPQLLPPPPRRCATRRAARPLVSLPSCPSGRCFSRWRPTVRFVRRLKPPPLLPSFPFRASGKVALRRRCFLTRFFLRLVPHLLTCLLFFFFPQPESEVFEITDFTTASEWER